MRNLKKLFAVVMIVAMLASMMVPALAAGVEYDDEAGILQDLNLFQGYGAGDLGLEDDLTREQGLALMLRVMGLEEEVKAMTEEEIAEGLAKVTDPETITDTWAKPYVAYAVLNGLTNGIDASTLPNVKFAGQLKMNGQEFINLMLNGMGYRTAWDDVLAKAAEVEILSAGEAVTFGTIKEMKRDQAVAIMYNALTGITSEGILLAQALVDAGAVDADKMIEYGFIEEEEVVVEPVEITAEATTDNLIQIYVEFNTEVDKDSAQDEGNYDIDDVEVKAAALQDDGVTVVLTLEKAMEQQDKVDLVISGVKDADGEVIDEFTIEDIEFLDMTIPTAIDALVVGNDTFKVIFSEPMNDESAEKGDFVVNGGKLYVKDITFQKNNTEALVTMYSLFKEGEVTLQVKSGTEDYAGFGVIGKLFTLEVVEDEEAPVVIGYEKAKRGEVTLIWSEDIEENGTITLGEEPDVYHTNAKNPASDVEIDGNKMKLTFENEDDWLPAGTAYVYVLKDTVRDLWNNKNAQQMTEIEVEVDEEPPVVDGSIKVVSETKIEIKFDEALKKKPAEEEDNYTILDDKGEEVENIIDDITYSSKKVTITFYEDLKGDHSIVIKDVEDIYGNKMPKTVVDFFVGDVTAPDYKEDFKAVLYIDKDGKNQMVKVSFGEAMATEGKYAVNDIEKYEINDIPLVNIKDVEIKVVDDGKAIEIHIPSKADFEKPEEKNKDDDNLDYHDVEAKANAIEIARVADAAGNYIAPLSYIFDIDPSDEIKVDGNVEATAKKTLKIKFDDNVAKFDIDDILVSKADDEDIAIEQAKVKDSVYRIDIAEVDTALDKGKTVVTITLAKDMDPDLATPVYVYIIGDKSTNVYDKTLEKGRHVVKDKIAPEVIKDGIEFAKKDDVPNNIITIKYNEALKNDAALVALYAQDLIVKNRDNKTLVANVDYETSVLGSVLTVEITKDKDEVGFNLEKYSVECKDTVNYIQDAKGNKAKSFDRERN